MRAGLLGVLWGGRRRIDPAAAALIVRMTTPPTAARAALINSTIVSLKAAGVWDLLDALWVMAAADTQAAGLNWKSSSFTLSPVNSPTFTVDRGYAGDGATSYLDTQLNPSLGGLNYARDSTSFGIWCLQSAQTANSVAGFVGTVGTSICPRNTSDQATYRINFSGATITPANADGSGLFMTTRPASNDVNLYRNSTLLSNSARLSAAPENGNFRIGSAGTTIFSNKQVSIALTGSSLSASEVTAVYQTLTAYLTGVGAI